MQAEEVIAKVVRALSSYGTVLPLWPPAAALPWPWCCLVTLASILCWALWPGACDYPLAPDWALQTWQVTADFPAYSSQSKSGPGAGIITMPSGLRADIAFVQEAACSGDQHNLSGIVAVCWLIGSVMAC